MKNVIKGKLCVQLGVMQTGSDSCFQLLHLKGPIIKPGKRKQDKRLSQGSKKLSGNLKAAQMKSVSAIWKQ